MSHQFSSENERILRLPEVIQTTGKKRSTIYADIGAGTFPKPINLGARSVGWSASSIQQWIATRIAASHTNDGGN